ncbi:MAG: hypothetical protein NVS2B7_18570 [Herpetosiphon sp.]
MTGTLSFGQWLKQRRKALDLTQEELAEQVGCAAETLRKIEGDLRRPSRDIAERIAAAVTTSPAERVTIVQVARGLPASAILRTDLLTSNSDPAASRPVASGHAAIPIPLTPLIGRVQETAAVSALVTRRDVRLVTLTGPGGTGKTRLALQIATVVVAAFAHGITWVDLAPLGDATQVSEAIATALDLPPDASSTMVQRLQRYLHDQQILLLLDNFEHVLAAAPLLTDLLRSAAGLAILVTSRERLHLSGEHAVPVPPLTLPDPHVALAPDQLAQCEAVQLFVARAQAATPLFQLIDGNASAVSAICHRLDGLPLAIELAAARCTLFSLPALLQHLGEGMAVLTHGPRDVPTRHQTLRTTIDWSYNLLSDDEQRLFTRLGVFVGGWTVAAADAICNPDSALSLDILDGLQSLLDKSLIQPRAEVDGEASFTMLETIHEYARERLAADMASAALCRQHADYYLTLAAARDTTMYGGPQQGRWLARMDQEHGNVRTALSWILNHRVVELGWRFCAALAPFWGQRGYLVEARRWLDTLFALPGVLTADVPLTLKTNVLLYAARLAQHQTDFVQEQTLLNQTLTLCRAAADQTATPAVLLHVAHVAARQGDVSRQSALLTECVSLCQSAGDTVQGAQALQHLAVLAARRGDPDGERSYMEQSFLLARATVDDPGRALALLRIGNPQWLRSAGARHLARTALEESLTLFRHLGDTLSSSEALWRLGATLRDEDAVRATVLIEESIALCRQLGARSWLAFPLQELAATLLLRDDNERAQALAEESMALHHEVGQQGFPAGPLLTLGHLAKHRGDYPRAVACLTDSLTIRRAWNDAHGMALCLAGWGGVAAGEGHAERAARLLGAAVAGLAATGNVASPYHRELERDIAIARAQLDTATWDAASTAGQAMTLEAAIAYALEGDHVRA